MKNIFVCYLIIFNLIKFNNFCANICTNCCETNNFKTKNKSFLSANENGATKGALERLKTYLNTGIFINKFKNLNEFITQKENNLYMMDNDTKLSICSEIFIISELIYLLHRCYYNYSSFVQYYCNDKFDKFKQIFITFLTVCDLMINDALSNYEDDTKCNNDNNDQLFNQLKNNTFNENNITSADIINIKDTVFLRNKISELFYKVFCKLIKNRFSEELKCENITEEEVIKIDAISF